MIWVYLLFALLSTLLFPLISRKFKLYEELDGLDEMRHGGMWHLIRGALRLGPILSLALMGRYWIQQLAGPESDPWVELVEEALLDLFYVVPLFLVLIPVVGRFDRRYGRATVETRISVLVFFGFVLPAWIQQTNADAAMERRTAAVQELIDLNNALRTRWIADLREANAHGPVGEVPPMVHVESEDGSIEVANLAGRDICLRIAGLYSPNPRGDGERCDFRQLAESAHCLVVPASSSLTLIPKREDCLQRPIEFRVGDFEHDEVAWWTDSALRDFEDRAQRALDNQSHFYYREMSDYQLSKEISRLESMTPDAQRAERWRANLETWQRSRH
jgi:hypothetical protein